MKQTLAVFSALLMSSVNATVVVEGDLNKVLSPTFVTALITTFFLYVMLTFGFGQLMAIQTPPYQLKYDEKNKENNKDWSQIFGNIEVN